MTSAVTEGCVMCFENTKDRAINYWGRVKEDFTLERPENWLELEETEDRNVIRKPLSISQFHSTEEKYRVQMTAGPHTGDWDSYTCI